MDPKKNPANILGRESLKPGGVEMNAEGFVLGTYSSRREI